MYVRRAGQRCTLDVTPLPSASGPYEPMLPAVIELFSPGWAWPVHRDWLDQDEQSTLQWWCMSVEVSRLKATNVDWL